jgi:hypothetical protein
MKNRKSARVLCPSCQKKLILILDEEGAELICCDPADEAPKAPYDPAEDDS